MKSFFEILNEAVAAKTFSQKWEKLVKGVAKHKKRRPEEVNQWTLTGHVYDYTDDAITKMKEKVFGKMGSSEMLFYTSEGILTFPAIGDVIHADLKRGALKFVPKEMTSHPNFSHESYKKLENSHIYAQGRIQHHAGGGVISLLALVGHDLKAAIRAITRAYPNYKIHDGHGREYEVNEAATAKAKKPTAGFGAKWKKYHDSVRRAGEASGREYSSAAIYADSPWLLTGHAGIDPDGTKEIERMKAKVFGKRGKSRILFYTDKGILTFNADGAVTHSHITHGGKDHIHPDDHAEYEKMKSASAFYGEGRIDNNANGGGMISYRSHKQADLKAGIRALQKAYPKHKIHDGYGKEYGVNESRKLKSFFDLCEDIDVFYGLKGTNPKYDTLGQFRAADALPMAIAIGSNESKAKKIGSIEGLDLWERSVDYKDGPNHRTAQRHYVLVDKTGQVMLHMGGMAGTAEKGKQHADGMGDDLRVFSLGVHPRARERVSGKSLPTLLYQFLHSKGITIQSDNSQSQGGAALWNKMRKGELSASMTLHKGKGVEVPAKDVADDEIWNEDPNAHEFSSYSPTDRKVKARKSLSGAVSDRVLILRGKKK